MAHNLPLSRLGVVGGGQLARMLAPACHAHHVELTILDPEVKSPAGQVAGAQIVGALHDPEALKALCQVSDVVTFDLENIGADILMTLAEAGVRMVPSPAVVRLIQNKLHQKQHYQTHGLPSTRFMPLPADADFSCVEAFGLPCVQKACTGGYDGRGVHVIRNESDWQRRLPVDSFVEAFVPQALELAVMVARNASGDMVAYDPVEMVVDPDLNLLRYLLAPARVSAEVTKAAVALAQETVASFSTEGLFGVELFLTESGELLVNEVAPRAHNSGHHTIEACVTSQFENQLRACLNLPLGQTDLRGCALTMNLVGAEGYRGAPVVEGLDALLKQSDVHVHLYGKSECRPGRKMGHVTIMGDDQDALIAWYERASSDVQIRGAERV